MVINILLVQRDPSRMLLCTGHYRKADDITATPPSCDDGGVVVIGASNFERGVDRKTKESGLSTGRKKEKSKNKTESSCGRSRQYSIN